MQITSFVKCVPSLLAITFVFVAGCGSTATGPNGTGPAATVDIKGRIFDPDTVTIHAGEAVVWRNNTLDEHTVTDDPDKAERKHDVELPQGAEAFDSGLFGFGKTYQHVFIVPGTYRYFCQPHESKRMVGVVVVLPAQEAQPPATPQPETQPAPTTQPAPAVTQAATIPAP